MTFETRITHNVQQIATSLPFSYMNRDRQTDFRRLHISFKTIFDDVMSLNSILTAEVYIFDSGQSPGIDDGVVSEVLITNSGKKPDYYAPCNQPLIVDYNGVLSVVLRFVKPDYFALTGNVRIAYCLNTTRG